MPTPTVLSLWFGGATGISNVLDLSTATAVVGIIMPDDWTPAFVTIEGSADGTTFHELFDGTAATELRFNVRPGVMIMLNPNRLRCCKALRLVSGTPDKPIPQGVAREFFVVVEVAT